MGMKVFQCGNRQVVVAENDVAPMNVIKGSSREIK